jgi:hypothetical protein
MTSESACASLIATAKRHIILLCPLLFFVYDLKLKSPLGDKKKEEEKAQLVHNGAALGLTSRHNLQLLGTLDQTNLASSLLGL